MLRYLVLGWLLLSTVSAWAIKPLATYWAKPDTLGLKYQDLTLTTPDHVHLAAWLVAPTAGVPDQHTTVVVAGSDSGNMASQIFTAATLAAQGYQVLLFDYRGFGHSDAFAINQDYLYYPEFTTDLRTALAEARRRNPRQRVGVLSFSMGTIMGAEAAATTHCDFLMTVGYVASPQAVAAYYQRTRPERPVLLPAAVATYGQVAAKVNCPWLLISGKDDKVTTLADSQAVARAAKGPQRRQVLPMPGDHQASMMVLAGEEQNRAYAQGVSRFLAQRPVAGKK
jgi:predicted alpha/beta hydrolase